MIDQLIATFAFMEPGKVILFKKIAFLLFFVLVAEAYSIQTILHFLSQAPCSGNVTDLYLNQETDSGDEDQIDLINTFELSQFPEYKNQCTPYITSLLTFVVAVWQPPKVSWDNQ